MASRAFHDLLLRSREALARHESTAWIVLGGLLLFHLAVIVPFTDAGRRQAEATADRQRLQSIGPSVEALQQQLDAAREASMMPFRSALAEFSEGLDLDLQRLEASRWQWQQARSIDDDNSSDSSGSEPTLDDSLALQAPPRGVVPLPIDAAQRAELAGAPNRYALLSLLEPLVEAKILAPRTQELERQWQTQALPPLINGLDAVGSEISQLRGQLPEARKPWDALSAALTELSRQAQAWKLDVPAAPFWWASAESEPTLRLGLGEHAESLRRPPSLARLAVTQQQVGDRLDAVMQAWEQRRAEIPTVDAGQRGILGLDLDGFAPWFPLALGLLMALLIVRRTHLLNDLAKLVHQAISQGSPNHLATWFAGLLAPGQAPATPLATLTGRAQRRVWLVMLAAWTWLGVAGVHLHGDPRQDWRPWIPLAVGAAVVLLAVIQRLRLQSRMLDRLADLEGNNPEPSWESSDAEVYENGDGYDDASPSGASTDDEASLDADDQDEPLVEAPLRR